MYCSDPENTFQINQCPINKHNLAAMLCLFAGEHATPSGLGAAAQTAEPEQASPAMGQVAASKGASSAQRPTSAGKGRSKKPLLTATGNPTSAEAKAPPKGTQMPPSPFAAAAGTSRPDSSSAAQKVASPPNASSRSLSQSASFPSRGTGSLPLTVAPSTTSPRVPSQALTYPTRGPQSLQAGPQSPTRGPLSPPRGPLSPPRGPQSATRAPQSPTRAPMLSVTRSKRGPHSPPAQPTLTEQPSSNSRLTLRPSSSDASKEPSAAQIENTTAAGKVSSQHIRDQSQTQAASDRQNPSKHRRLVKAGSMVKETAAEAPAAAPASTEARPVVKPAAVGGLAFVPLPKPKPVEKLPTEEELRLADEEAPYQQEPFGTGRFSTAPAGRFGSAPSSRAAPVLGSAAQLLRAGEFASNQPHTASNAHRAVSHMTESHSARCHLSPSEANIRPQSGYRVSTSPLSPAQSEADQDVSQGPVSTAPGNHASGASQPHSPLSWPMGHSPWAPAQQPQTGQPAAAPATLDKAQSDTAAAVEQPQASQHLSQQGKAEGKQLPGEGQSHGSMLSSRQSASASQRQQDRHGERPFGFTTFTAEAGVTTQSSKSQSQACNELGTLQSHGSPQIPGDRPQGAPQDPRKHSVSLLLHPEGSHQQGHQYDQGTSEQQPHQPGSSQQQIQGKSRQQPRDLHGSSRQDSRHRSQSQGSQAFSEAPDQAMSFGMKRSVPACAEPEMLRMKLQYRWGLGSFSGGYLDLQAFIWSTDTVGRSWNAAGKVCCLMSCISVSYSAF